MPSANDRFLIRHHHLPEVETHRSVPLSIAIGPAIIREKKLKIRIVPIAIGMCQVPPIACQQAQSYSRCRSTSIIVSPNPIGPVVQTVFAKRLKINVPIVMCQVPPIDSQWAPSYYRGRITSISASPIPIEPAVRTLFAKGLKIRIVPIAISMCQVPSIDSQEAPSSSRGGNTSISASPTPIGPAVRTLFV